MLIINNNIASLTAIRNQSRSQSQLNTSLQRLSSGLRINSAKDDAAGLAISTRMETQIRGMSQSRRNINDAISMMQTAEKALGEMTNLIQRGRQLSVQAANATNSSEDRAAVQEEINQLVGEIERIAASSKFNGIELFTGGSNTIAYDPNDSGLTPDQQELVSHLQTSWLEQSEKMLETYFGIKGDGAGLKIEFVEGHPALAYVSYTGTDAEGKGLNLTLSIDLDDFLPSEWPNGGPSSISNDRIILHEMTHAVMARSINMAGSPLWFIEGAAEFIHGADSRLYGDITAQAGGSTAAKVDALMNGFLTNDGSVEQYSAGYAAVRYLHQAIINEGGTGIKEVFDYLKTHSNSTLDDAIVDMKATYSGLGFSDQASLEAFFDTGDAGNTYVTNLYNSGSLTNSDTGAVGGADADGGSRDTSAAGTVPDIANANTNPLAYFEELFPSSEGRKIVLAETNSITFQVGADVNQTIDIGLTGINKGNLGISETNVITNAVKAIAEFDAALGAIVSERARLGGIQNRLESAAAVMETNIENIAASRSRIIDADYAKETAAFTRSRILAEAGNAIIAQANALPNVTLSLLTN